MWDKVAFKGTDGEWELLGDNGFFALMAWAAGPDNVRKTVQSDAGRTVQQTRIRNGVETRELVPFTQADRHYIDDDNNEYLQAAGIPTRPSGFDWYLCVPSGWQESGPRESGSRESGPRESGRRESGPQERQSEPRASVIQAIGTIMNQAQHDQQSPAQLRPHVERIVAEFYAAAKR